MESVTREKRWINFFILEREREGETFFREKVENLVWSLIEEEEMYVYI